MENSLIVIHYNCYKDLVANRKVDVKEIERMQLENGLAKECLYQLKRLGCDYIIAGYDERNVIIYSKLNKLVSLGKKRFRVGYSYWIKKPNNHLICGIDGTVTRYNGYSVMPWMSLYNLICEASDKGCILEQDLKKRYVTKKTQKKAGYKLNKLAKNILRNVKRYSNRVKEIWDMEEPTQLEDNEMMFYRQKFNIMNAIKISDIFESGNEEEINKIIELTKTAKNYYEVINKYSSS